MVFRSSTAPREPSAAIHQRLGLADAPPYHLARGLSYLRRAGEMGSSDAPVPRELVVAARHRRGSIGRQNRRRGGLDLLLAGRGRLLALLAGLRLGLVRRRLSTRQLVCAGRRERSADGSAPRDTLASLEMRACEG